MIPMTTLPDPNVGRKDDSGKLPWDLVPYDAIEAGVEVLQFGAKKYAPRNWEKGIIYSRLFSALLRHLFAWWRGENKDLETGLSHLAHAWCCLNFMLAFERRGRTDLDDRPGQDDVS